MSEEHPVAEALSARLLDAINDVLGQHGGGMVNGFIAVVDYLDSDGEPSFALTVAPDQRGSMSSGLARLRAGQHRPRPVARPRRVTVCLLRFLARLAFGRRSHRWEA